MKQLLVFGTLFAIYIVNVLHNYSLIKLLPDLYRVIQLKDIVQQYNYIAKLFYFEFFSESIAADDGVNEVEYDPGCHHTWLYLQLTQQIHLNQIEQ